MNCPDCQTNETLRLDTSFLFAGIPAEEWVCDKCDYTRAQLNPPDGDPIVLEGRTKRTLKLVPPPTP